MDPFVLLKRLVWAAFVITGHAIVLFVQVIWFLAFLHPDKVGEAIGQFGRSATDTLAAVFRPS